MISESNNLFTTEQIGYEKHYDPHDVDKEWTTDFYAYFDASENATRYTPTLHFLMDQLPDAFSLLDMACGSGTLIKFLPECCQYTGVDHSPDSIRFCQKNFPTHTFVQSDVIQYLTSQQDKHHAFDVIMMCGLLFNSIDWHDHKKLNDVEILSLGLKCLHQNSFLALITPFVFSDHPDFTLMKQATWKWQSLERLIQEVDGTIAFQNMSVQVGLEKKVEAQSVKPDWYLSPGEGNPGRWNGTYMAAWSVILKNNG